ncbi:MAG: hypothetical protein KKA42_02100 [candidate division Zixibacteria bacterium]|nr:hypothetical protein [candidate division Zixibacteria bacterium]
MKRLLLAALSVITAVVAAGAADEPFEAFKQATTQAGCNRFTFLYVLESDVFDTVDTTRGAAIMSADGRYRVDIGPDTYLYDLTFLYSYSSDNNQVTVERLADPVAVQREVSFVARLDDYYTSNIVQPGLEYHLMRRDSTDSSIPTSMTVFLRPGEAELDRLEFLDINDDLNRMLVLNHEVLTECATAAFLPNFPDSVETIRLY